MPRHSIVAVFLGAALALAAIPTSEAQDNAIPPEPPSSAESAALPDGPQSWFDGLEAIDRELGGVDGVARDRARELSTEILRIQSRARALDGQSAARIGPLRREIDSLGPAPAEGQPPESAQDVLLRQQLQDRLAELESLRRLSRLTIVRAENLQTRLIRLEASRLDEKVHVRTPSLFAVDTWTQAADTSVRLNQLLIRSPASWWRQLQGGGFLRLIVVLGAILLMGSATFVLRRRLAGWISDGGYAGDPVYASRVRNAFASASADILLPVVSLLVSIIAIRALSDFDTLFVIVIYRACIAAIVYFAAVGLSRAAFQAPSSEWRLVPVSDEAAGRLIGGVRALVFVAMAAFWYIGMAKPAGLESAEFRSVATFIADFAVVVLGLRILPSRFIPSDTEKSHIWIRIFSGIIAVILIANPFVNLASYGNLASYLLLYLIISVTAIGLAMLIRAAAIEAVDWAVRPERRIARIVSESAKSTGAEFLRLVLMLTMDILIFVPLVWLLLILYGIPPAQLLIWMNHFINGFTIGTVTIAPFDMILAVIVFAGVLLVTNLIRRALTKQLLERTQMDVGVRNAILSGIGYTGIVIGIVSAIATIGLDLSNLALVASALSVGIGFGLRAIVENFVAGILLLIERPIKEGDWIVAGGRNGTVKKISVRSTEIETFDRSTVIVPNSELIAQPVENWSHRNRNARVIIPVGVAYGSDTGKVREIILGCVADNPDIMKFPEPQVLFLAFGDSSLDFEVRYFVRDTDIRLITISDMHFAIDQAFRDAGIEIPFPQRDLHMKGGDMPGVEK